MYQIVLYKIFQVKMTAIQLDLLFIFYCATKVSNMTGEIEAR